MWIADLGKGDIFPSPSLRETGIVEKSRHCPPGQAIRGTMRA